MIAHQKATVGLATGGWPSRGSATEPQDKPPTLAEAVLSALRWCAVFQFIGFLRGIDQNLAPIGARRRQHRGDQRRPQPCGRGVDLDQLDVVTGETSINNIVNGALSGPPIDWRWATTMSVQTTFFSALEERQRPDKGGVAMIKGCTHIYAPKGQTGEYATLAANHRGNGARPVPSGVRRVSPRYRASSGVSLTLSHSLKTM